MDISIVEDNTLMQKIADDPIFNENEVDANSPNLDVNHIIQSESQLSSQLHDLKRLKVLSGLIKEFNTNLDLLEFENCYYSLQNLRKKLHENNEAFIKQSFHFQRSVAMYIDTLHLNLIETIYEIISAGFWNITDTSIGFKSDIQWANSNFEISYDSIIELLNQLFYSNGTIEPKFWFITDMEFGDSKDAVRSKLTDILKNYIGVNSITNAIKDAIFTKNTYILFDSTDNTVRFSSSSENSSVETILASFTNLNDFLLNSFPKVVIKNLLLQLGNVLSNEFSKCLKNNASQILGTDNVSLKEQVSHINNQLYELSKLSKGMWNYNKQDIKDLLEDKQFYRNLLLDNIFHKQVAIVRETFDDIDEKWKETKQIQLKLNKNDGIINFPESKVHEPVAVEADPQNDWAWEVEANASDDGENDHNDVDNVDDIDDAWGSEIDVDLGPQSPKKSIIDDSIRSRKDSIDNEDGGWNEAWDIGDDEDIEENKPVIKEELNEIMAKSNTHISTPDSYVEITQLPEIFINVFENFKKECQKIQSDIINDHYYNYKLSLLQTTFFAISVSYATEEWWKFYIDMRAISKKDESTYRIQELANRYLESNRFTRQKMVWKLVQKQLFDFHERENSATWSVVLEELIPFVNEEIITPLTKIKGVEAERELLRFLDFFYNKCLIDVILKWDIISEKNSENLGKLISLISSNTEIPFLNKSSAYRECRVKFDLVGRFLPLHLNEIMDMFYNGDFYLFSTDEIVQWVKLLFADTPIRMDAITDIFGIRQAALEDN